MKTTHLKGFTLVELVVVITILAILSTIALVTYLGHEKDARDSRRMSDIANITRGIGLLDLQGLPMLGLVSDDSSGLVGASYGGEDAIVDVNYKAGKVNFQALKMRNVEEYRLGITITSGTFYEIVATLENAGIPKTIISGNFMGRTISGTTVTSLGIEGFNSKQFSIGDADLNKLRKGDLLSGSIGHIAAISPDGKTITISGNAPAKNTKLNLMRPETDGLIASMGDNHIPVKTNMTGSGELAYPLEN